MNTNCRSCFVAGIVALILLSVVQLSGNEVAQLLDDWYWRREPFDPTAVDVTQKQRLIEELRKWDDPSDPIRQERSWTFRVELGDRELAGRLVSLLQQDSSHDAKNARYVLQSSTQPWIIPLLAQALLTKEPIERSLHDYTFEEQSLRAAILIGGILKRSPAFSDRVNESAGRLPFVPQGYEAARASVRHWWQQNKEHFEKEDYAAVTPLKITDSEPIYGANAPIPESLMPFVRPASPDFMVPAPVTTATTVVPPAAATSPSPRWLLRTVAFLIILSVGGAGWVIYVRQERSGNSKTK